jgi:ABC-type branched-subunit amino acid transport system ATPase component
VEAATEAAIDLAGIGAFVDTPVEHLSTGQRRLVELARVLAGPFDIILLDEPSSGLDQTETYRFGEILRHVVERRGVGIFLVEHDMALVEHTCERVYVLDFGRLLFEGSTDETLGSDLVRAAYLGSNDAAGVLARAGAEVTADETS